MPRPPRPEQFCLVKGALTLRQGRSRISEDIERPQGAGVTNASHLTLSVLMEIAAKDLSTFHGYVTVHCEGVELYRSHARRAPSKQRVSNRVKILTYQTQRGVRERKATPLTSLKLIMCG